MILINSSPKDALKIFQPFLPIFVPVGMGCLVAFLQRENIKVDFIDEQVEEDVLLKVSRYIANKQKPYIFGFSVVTAAFKSAINLSRQLKKIYPDSLVVFGGIHPSALPEESLSYKHIDLVVRGEGERALAELYKCVKEARCYTHIPGLSYRKDGVFVHNDIFQDLLDLNDLPPFPYHLFKSKSYDLGFILSSRGCPHRCIFCSNRVTTGRRYRFCSASKIIHDLKWLDQYFKITGEAKRSVQFLDDNLLVNKDRIYELIEQIRSESLNKSLTFSFQARGDNVDYKILKDLFDAGFKSVFFGLETASENLMRLINKDETVAECVAAVKMAKEIGYHVSATFIYGLPGETHEDRMGSLRLSKELKLNMVRYNNATPYPGTELYDLAKEEKALNIVGLYENFFSTSTFIEYPFKEIPFSYVPKGNTENGIRNDLLYSYFSFYFDFNKIREIFASPEKGVGWFNAGATILNFVRKLPALGLLGINIFLKFYKLFISIMLGKIDKFLFCKSCF